LPDHRDLDALDVRVGTVTAARVLQGARTPTLAFDVDFGEAGTRLAVAEVSELYDSEDLVGLQVVGVVNLPPRQVAGLEVRARVLTVGDSLGHRVLVIPERPVPDGGRAAGEG
jgi:tRNA-binding protein